MLIESICDVVSCAARCVWVCVIISEQVSNSIIDIAIVATLSIIMLDTTCELSRTIEIAGYKKEWQIKSDEIVIVDETCFVKLNVGNSSLSSVIGNVGGYLCLSRSIGLQELTDFRNAETDLIDIVKLNLPLRRQKRSAIDLTMARPASSNEQDL